MALAKDLGPARCENILRDLVELTGRTSGRKLGIHCPWHKEETPGACWYDPELDRAVCYGCQHHGDLVDIYAVKMGLPEGSLEAIKGFFEKYAPEHKGSGKRGGDTDRPRAPRAFTARESIAPEASWQDGAVKWVEKCAARLTPAHHERLAVWGITPATASACRIGWNDKDQFVKYTAWGLPYDENKNGRERCIHLPTGFVFPVFGADGALQRVKVRLEHPGPDEPKYKAVVGGGTGYAIFGDRQKSRTWIIVETERDAMLLWQELGPYGIGAMGTGSASMQPDSEAHALLQAADCILCALDTDAAGGRAAWRFDPERFGWDVTYPQAIRWPVPACFGKDPADMVGKYSLKAWALAGLPGYVRDRAESALLRAQGAAVPVAADAPDAAQAEDEEVF